MLKYSEFISPLQFHPSDFNLRILVGWMQNSQYLKLEDIRTCTIEPQAPHQMTFFFITYGAFLKKIPLGTPRDFNLGILVSWMQNFYYLKLEDIRTCTIEPQVP